MSDNNRVKEIRAALSMTQEKFGERVGLKKSALSQIENGVNGVTDQLRRSICREFNVNEEWLRTGNGDMFVKLNRDEEIAAFLGDTMRDSGGFQARLISVLSRLSPEEWVLLEDMANRLAEETKKGDP